MHDTGLSRCSQLESCSLRRILAATRHLAAPTGVDEILQKTIASALQVLDADRGSVFLYDPRANELYIKVSTGSPQAGTGADAGHPDDQAVSHVIRFP